MRFCKDCTHYVGMLQGPDDSWYERCQRPLEPVFDLVTGKAYLAKQMMPSDERYGGACGLDAQFFEWKVKATEVKTVDKPWVARGWHGNVLRLVYEKRFAQPWEAQDALTVIEQRGTRFSRVTIDYEPIKSVPRDASIPQ